MTFSWKQAKENAIATAIRRHKTKLKQYEDSSNGSFDKEFIAKNQSDLKILKSNPKLIENKIKEKMEKHQLRTMERRFKLVGK